MHISLSDEYKRQREIKREKELVEGGGGIKCYASVVEGVQRDQFSMYCEKGDQGPLKQMSLFE